MCGNGARVNAPPSLHVNIDVPALEPAIRFYCDGVGLRLERRLFGGTVAELGGSSSLVYLLEKPPGTPPAPSTRQQRDYGRHWTPVHIDFVVAEFEEAVDRATRAGANLEGGIGSFAWGRIATMSDPFGNGFCLIEWRGAGYAEVETGAAARSAGRG